MNLRTKLIIVFVALALVPLLALCVVQYRAGAAAVETSLRERAGEHASRMAHDVEQVLGAQESRLRELAGFEPLRRYALERRAAAAAGAPPAGDADPAARGAAAAEVAGLLAAYAAANREYLQCVTFIERGGQAALRLERREGGQEFAAQTSEFVSSQSRHDERVWAARSSQALRSPLSRETYGAALRLTAPVFSPAPAEEGGEPAGAVVAEIRLGDVAREACETAQAGAARPGVAADEPTRAGAARRIVIALDNANDAIVYHTNDALKHQTASSAMPFFAATAARMRAGESGHDFYDAPGGGRRLAAFRQAEGLGLSLAASEDYAAALAPVRRAALVGGGLSLLAALTAAALLSYIAGRETRGIGRVTRGASAIAAGDLDQRIDVSHSGETRELAENFNAMTERLRELIAREAESRQFASFMRISAMVSHDLKNAIAGLSMLVSNMERQFHREEFRADAIESLREATEKLKRTVARLNEPAKSLSGEYRIAARPTDLVPIIRRVLATNAEPTRPLNEVEARLPDRLVATVEPERIENVVENLVINALEAMGARGGRLTVEAGALEGDLVFFGVEDTGVGMTEEFVKTRLFRPFSTTKNKGIGLGLFTCREVVEAHGGRLEVDSRPGAGTRFRVVLPSRLFHSGERRERPEKVTAPTESAPPDLPG
ncbi:MAG TPA: ATP-binding protein [Pyrinomonadaceae bacterium]